MWKTPTIIRTLNDFETVTIQDFLSIVKLKDKRGFFGQVVNRNSNISEFKILCTKINGEVMELASGKSKDELDKLWEFLVEVLLPMTITCSMGKEESINFVIDRIGNLVETEESDVMVVTFDKDAPEKTQVIKISKAENDRNLKSISNPNISHSPESLESSSKREKLRSLLKTTTAKGLGYEQQTSNTNTTNLSSNKNINEKESELKVDIQPTEEIHEDSSDFYLSDYSEESDTPIKKSESPFYLASSPNDETRWLTIEESLRHLDCDGIEDDLGLLYL